MLTLLGNVTFDTHSQSIKQSKWDVYVIILAPRAQGVSWKREMKEKESGARDGIGHDCSKTYLLIRPNLYILQLTATVAASTEPSKDQAGIIPAQGKEVLEASPLS